MAREHVFERETIIRARLADVFDFFSRPGNLARITPPEMGFQIVNGPERKVRTGDRIEYRIRVNGIPIRWVTLITDWAENERFADVQEKGPYRKWHHTHSFEETPEGVLMRDRVEYQLPFGFPGDLLGSPFVRRSLERIFDYRSQIITEIFPGSAHEGHDD